MVTPSTKVDVSAWNTVKYSQRNPHSVQSTLFSYFGSEKFLQISVKIKYGPPEHVIIFLCPQINFFYENNTIEVMKQLYDFK